MDFKINGGEKELNFGVRFIAELDKTDTLKVENMIEFGVGLMMAEEKLGMGSIETLANIIKSALHREFVTLDHVYDSLDEYAEDDKLDEVFDMIGEALKNSKAVHVAKSRMKNQATEQNRKKSAVKAVK